MLLGYSIVSLISMLLAFAIAGFLNHRKNASWSIQAQEYVLQLQTKEAVLRKQAIDLELQGKQLNLQDAKLKERTEAIRTMMYRTHHLEVNPICKRIRGLSGLGIMASSRLFNFCEQLSKPGHQEFSKLAMAENKEILECFRKIGSQALELETDNLNNVKEFEHLQ
jgi:hypothetical protein